MIEFTPLAKAVSLSAASAFFMLASSSAFINTIKLINCISKNLLNGSLSFVGGAVAGKLVVVIGNSIVCLNLFYISISLLKSIYHVYRINIPISLSFFGLDLYPRIFLTIFLDPLVGRRLDHPPVA
jgi:hypothetical protein